MQRETNPPSLNDAFDRFKREIMRDLNCVQIGQVESFNAGNQTASIRLVIKRVVSVENDGTRILKERPLLVSCPVMVLSGGPGYLTMPIAKGDTCIVLFNDREIDNWFHNGGIQAPETNRMHDLSDAIAIVGIRNMQNKIADYIEDGVQLGYGDNNITITEIGAEANTSFAATSLHAVNGATGTFNLVTVVDGIVVGGS